MIKIGLTGGIASGKTTVTNHLKALGFKVIEADEIAREVLEIYPEILAYLRLTYGEKIFNEGKLNRRLLGKIIFQNEIKREEYGKVIMPRIIEEIKKRLEASENDIVFVDAPLLFEEGLDEQVDYTITVYVRRSIQLKR
ncbi:MAG: dephospho-CoA kinase [Clostridium sp.]|nr:dephospho-CoA kinase [Clostridium sp.]